MSGSGTAGCGAKRTTNGKSPSDCEKDDRAAKGAVALRGHSERQLLAPSRYPEADIPCDERSIATLVSSSSALFFAGLLGPGVESGYRPICLPKLHIVAVDEPPGGFDGGLIINTIQLNHANGSVV